MPTHLNRDATLHETVSGPRATKKYRAPKPVEGDWRRWGSSTKSKPNSITFTDQLRGETRRSELMDEQTGEIFCLTKKLN